MPVQKTDVKYPPLYKLSEVAAALGVSREQATTLVRRGVIKRAIVNGYATKLFLMPTVETAGGVTAKARK